jgi:hypothetical protein
MYDMYVDVEALNFRSAPSVQPDNLIGKLYLTQKVEVMNHEPDDWVKCKAKIGARKVAGYASRKFLRLPLSSNREALIAAVHREYMRFDRGLGKEHVSPYAGYVGEM